MHSRLEDDAQYEWCRQWEEEHRRKITRKMQKKIRRFSTGVTVSYMSSMLGMSSGQ